MTSPDGRTLHALGQSRTDRIERGDRVDEVRESGAVGLQPLDQALGLPHDVRRAVQHAAEAGRGQRVVVEGRHGRGGHAEDDSQRDRQRLGRAPQGAQADGAEQSGAQQRADSCRHAPLESPRPAAGPAPSARGPAGWPATAATCWAWSTSTVSMLALTATGASWVLKCTEPNGASSTCEPGCTLGRTSTLTVSGPIRACALGASSAPMKAPARASPTTSAPPRARRRRGSITASSCSPGGAGSAVVDLGLGMAAWLGHKAGAGAGPGAPHGARPLEAA